MTSMSKKEWTMCGGPPFFKGFRIAGMVVFGVVAAAVFALVFGVFVMLLWNWLMPLIFGLPEITYWQAFGIVILAKLIFGAMGHGKHRSDKFRPRDRWTDGTPFKNGMAKWRHWQSFWDDVGKKSYEEYVQKHEAGEDSSREEES
jgi:hypothetical protein